MSLREDIWEQLPDYVTEVKVERGDVHGAGAIKVTVYYDTVASKKMYMILHFSHKNQMTGEHIGRVVRSYLRNGIASQEVD